MTFPFPHFSPGSAATDFFVYDQTKVNTGGAGSTHTTGLTGFSVGSLTTGPTNGKPRVVHLAINWVGTQTLSSVTGSGGITFKILGQFLTTGGTVHISHATALVPSGTTLDITLNFSASVTSSSVSLWHGFPPNGIYPDWAVGDGTDITSTALNDNMTSDSGQYIANAITQATSATTSITWNGTGGTINTRLDANWDSGNNKRTHCDWITSADGDTADIIYASSNDVGSCVAVCFYNFGDNDPYWESVVMLPGIDRGTNGQTTGITELSPAAHGSQNLVASATLSTTQIFYGTSSLAPSGNSSGLFYADHIDWRLGASGDSKATVEIAFYPTSSVGMIFIGQYSATQQSWAISGDSSQKLRLRMNGANSITSGTSYTLNAWNYAAMHIDQAGSTSLRLNGVHEGSTAQVVLNNATSQLGIGNDDEVNAPLIGYCASARITVGKYRAPSTGTRRTIWACGVPGRLHPTS